MTYTETTTESWFSRIKGAFQGIVVGLVLVVAAVVLLFWNEGRTIKRYKTLKEGASAVVSLESPRVDPANEGKLVHATGKATTSEILTDDEFGVSVNAVKLVRNAEAYQWIEEATTETRDKLGGGTETVTTYQYKKDWSSTLIDSSSFKEPGHENPAQFSYASREVHAKDVSFGEFKLSESLILSIGPTEKYSIASPESTNGTSPTPDAQPAPTSSEVPSATTSRVDSVRLVAYQIPDPTISIDPTANANGSLSVSSDSTTQFQTTALRTIQNGGYYIGKNPQTPEIGDVRIDFYVVYPDREISVISEQQGNGFVPYQTKTGTIEMLENGVCSADAMFQSAQKSNKFLAWILRAVGLVLMFLGFCAIMKPLSVLADVVPFIGSIVGAGTSVFSFLIAAALSTTVISVAWLYYRPLVGVPLLVAAVVLLVLAFSRKKAVPTKS